MIIFYDMDEVLNWMSSHAIECYNRDYDDDFDWRMNTSWWWDDAPKADRAYFENLMNSPGFFIDTDPQWHGVHYMKRLIDEGYDVRIITYPVWNGICAKEKEEWTKKHLPFFDINRLYMAKDKWLMAAPDRILLDDNIENLKKWEEHGGISVAYSHTFNSSWKGLRVDTHEEFYKMIKTMTQDKT